MTELVIAMDGPAGTGKSTVSRSVANRLGLPHLDTGAFYRAAGLVALRAGLDLADEIATSSALGQVEMDQIDGRMLLGGVDVSREIRTPEATEASSVVSTHPSVRSILVTMQRAWVGSRGGRAVVEGRDIGSVVFPQATVKIYLDATPEVRAKRRAGESGEPYDEVLAQVLERDTRDSTRANSPLIVPDGAHLIDTSDMSLGDVVDRVIGIVEHLRT